MGVFIYRSSRGDLPIIGSALPIPFVSWLGGDSYVSFGPEDWDQRNGEDWARANTVEALPATPLGEKDERFKAGDILFSFRNLDFLGTIDQDRDAIVWCYGLGILTASISRQCWKTAISLYSTTAHTEVI